MIHIHLLREGGSPDPLGRAYLSLPATEETRRLLDLRSSRRISCPLDKTPRLKLRDAEEPNPELDEVRGPRWVLARLREADAKKVGLTAGWYGTALSVEDARKLKEKEAA